LTTETILKNTAQIATITLQTRAQPVKRFTAHPVYANRSLPELELSAGGFQNVLDNRGKIWLFIIRINNMSIKTAVALRFMPFAFAAQRFPDRDCGKTRQKTEHSLKNSAIRQRN